MDEQEARATTLAFSIYREVFGHLDDKNHKAAKVAEMRDWLMAGDMGEGRDVEDLAEEWREYDTEG